MNEYINRLLSISESLKKNQLYYPETKNLFSVFLDYEKNLRKNYIKDKGPIDILIKSSNDKILHYKIKNSNLSKIDIMELEKIRNIKLIYFRDNLYTQTKNQIEIFEDVDDLEQLDVEIMNSNLLLQSQKSTISTSIK